MYEDRALVTVAVAKFHVAPFSERATGYDPVSSAWKAEALPIRRRPHDRDAHRTRVDVPVTPPARGG